MSKVVPSDVPRKTNNFVCNDLNIINQSKYLIIVEAVLGINRVYLLQYNKTMINLIKVYGLMVVCLAAYNGIFSAIYKVINYTMILEYTVCAILCLTSGKNKMNVFFKNLSTFDETLNIQNDLAITSPRRRIVIWTTVILLYNMLEATLLCTCYQSDNMLLTASGYFVMTASHDLEQLFFITFLGYIHIRVMILKAHVEKLFGVNEKSINEMSEVEKLAEKKVFDVSTLNRVYEILHKCSDDLNSTMGIPILLIFFVSALTSIMHVKTLVAILQLENTMPHIDLFILYVVSRCIKHTVILTIPCYYSSVTAAGTFKIRTVLHDAVNTMPMTKAECRLVKTFFHLTRENDFSCTLCGVIKLSMSLPLGYLNLCTTYLVILIQFSKFID